MCRRRCTRRTFWRDRQAVRGQEKARCHRRGPARFPRRAPCQLQDAKADRVSRRVAENKRRQDSAPRPARRAVTTSGQLTRGAIVASAADVVSFWRKAGQDGWFNKDHELGGG